MSFSLLKEAAELSMISGGCIKFDLKAWNEDLNKALCGVGNRQTLENFRYLAELSKERKDIPFLIASTLLVPGYVDSVEIKKISRFIADLDPNIPYSLLGFHPDFYMSGLPTTSKKHAQECLEAAKSVGLKNVHIGNIHILSADIY